MKKNQKNLNDFSFTDFFGKIKPLLTHVRKTPPLRSQYSGFLQASGRYISKLALCT